MTRILALSLGLIASVAAHSLQITGVTLRLDGSATSVTVVAHVPMLTSADPASEIARRLRLRLDGQPFHAEETTLRQAPGEDTVTWSALTKQVANAALLEAPIFPDHPEDTTVVLIYRHGQLVERAALTPAHPSAILGETWFVLVRRFAGMGIGHVLFGAHHMLFLLGLILMRGPLTRLLAVITAFTVAHSLTLSLTVLGVSSLSPRLVEPVIALSIVVVGLENLILQGRSLEFRIWLAFGFGFFHGFGFAGALAEAGLPSQALSWSLAAFNLGVEIGQLGILLLALPLLSLLHRRHERWSTIVTRFVSRAIAMAGGYWFVARIWL